MLTGQATASTQQQPKHHPPPHTHTHSHHDHVVPASAPVSLLSPLAAGLSRDAASPSPPPSVSPSGPPVVLSTFDQLQRNPSLSTSSSPRPAAFESLSVSESAPSDGSGDDHDRDRDPVSRPPGTPRLRALRDCKDRLPKRTRVALEIVDTEESYVQSLAILVNEFIIPLRCAPSESNQEDAGAYTLHSRHHTHTHPPTLRVYHTVALSLSTRHASLH